MESLKRQKGVKSLSPSVQPAKLFRLHQDVQPAEFILENDVCTIGRSSMCDVVTPLQTVSRLHAKIELEGPRYVLHDMNSANGTFVSGRRILEPHLLQNDDVIGLGMPTPLLRFHDPDPTAPVQSQLRYDERAMVFFWNQQQIDLTAQEFRLMYHLYRHTGDVCTRKSCSEAIWNRGYDPGFDDDNLDRTISNIRGKLRSLDSSVDPIEIIKTRRGLGYELIL
ncbi:MAG: FHA domain-containing protein [Anaerolineaceae bacterium]|nr:FHA domain-containing protein [Anaerolineaceae bacterium]